MGGLPPNADFVFHKRKSCSVVAAGEVTAPVPASSGRPWCTDVPGSGTAPCPQAQHRAEQPEVWGVTRESWEVLHLLLHLVGS